MAKTSKEKLTISTIGEMKKNRRSFTLIEMLVVLAVIVLILGVSVPFFASFSKGAKLKTVASDVSEILNSARSLAITNRKNYSVVFDFIDYPHSYYIIDEKDQLFGKRYYLPSSIRFHRPNNPDSPTTFSSAKATFSSTGGLIGNSGSVWIADTKGGFRCVTVSNTTGRVKIDKEP